MSNIGIIMIEMKRKDDRESIWLWIAIESLCMIEYDTVFRTANV